MNRSQTALALVAEEPKSAATATETAPKPQGQTSAQTSTAIGTLRACITALVVAHHAVLAYHPYAPQPATSLTAEPRWWQAFPIVDSQRWGGFGLLTAFNDIFFMSLMFFLSGLFVWHSLQRKGSGGFLRDRSLRLGLPFVVAAAVLAPLAYFPTYLATGAAPSLSGFWRQWASLGQWPAGPAWFLWVLLAFDACAAMLFLLLPKWGETLGRLAANAARRPARFFWLLAAVSAVAYVPMAVAFTSVAWFSFGPFVVQTSRLFHYAVYFLAGAGVGAYGLEKGLLAPDGKLARRWPAWASAAAGAFVLALVILITALSSPGKPKLWETIGGFTFALSCAASSFAFLALFVRFAKGRSRFFASLQENAYGIFLIHYAFVSWLQYALLKTPLSGLAKGSCVFLGALALSWGVTAALRRIPGVARVI